MELLWSSEDFVIAGQPYPGFPILLWDSMASCVEANQFFRYHLLRGTIGSKNSWPSTGRALYDFFSFLQAHDLDWRDVDRGEKISLLASYRKYCTDTCSLALNTIRQRLTYVCAFYEFALKKNWVVRLPFNLEERIVKSKISFLEHASARGRTALINNAMPRNHKTFPKYLRMSDIKSLLSATDNPHHRIMIQLALHTGLRRNELATFPVTYIFDPEKMGRTERNLRISLDPTDGSAMQTKGGKPREILISRKLMSDLYHYVSKIRGERANLSNKHSSLLLNQVGTPYGDDGKSLNRIIGDIGKRAGVKVHTHTLRHTYATHTLANLQRQPQHGLDPLVFLQRQLGHSSIQTTVVYLHLINEMADQAVMAYDDELNNMTEDALWDDVNYLSRPI
ncbi:MULTISPECIES: tyrosine-type recombinase/integrase [Pseudomonas]|uniref:tyrosine-type recombinase/integrase n=1 Tax=Pseudomonas TaxID=286 RepID=UPI001F483D37|nr:MULTISPECIES: site-specific integrase [Pseudomonas]UJW22390.1 site-specific integrase [Pseudomonas juntendi]